MGESEESYETHLVISSLNFTVKEIEDQRATNQLVSGS